jgi:PDDEXK-like domain of unknown function (DUF3799)
MNVSKWNGRPISKPGWYSGIPLERYHGQGICDRPAVSSTDLRTCWSRSPAHMHLQWAENPWRETRPVTRAMTLGAAAHHLLLGEDGFKSRFIAQPATYRDRLTAIEKPWHNGARFCKAWAEKQTKAGKTVVTRAELEIVRQMHRSLSLLPLVNAGLLFGHVELSGFWRDQESGLWVKVRPDVIPTASGDYCDLKTAADVTTPAVQSSIRSQGYHQQAALVWEASQVFGMPWEMFVLLFIETSAPFCARAVPLTEADIARGVQQNRLMRRKIANCIVEDHWPGPGEDDPRELPLSHDERARIDARLKREGVA